MSLDVWLTLPGVEIPTTDDKIYIRDDGETKQITRAEWDALYPDRDPVIIVEGTSGEVFTISEIWRRKQEFIPTFGVLTKWELLRQGFLLSPYALDLRC